MGNRDDNRLELRIQPKTFEEVIGQPEAVRALSELVRDDYDGPVLLQGPFGTGKTVLAKIFGRAMNCETPTSSHSPCLSCKTCAGPDGLAQVYYLSYFNCATKGTKEFTTYLDEEMARIGAVFARKRIILLDEAQALTPQASEALLNAFETPRAAVFVLTTTDETRINAALRSRCERVFTNLVPPSVALAYAIDICDTQNFAYELDALQALVGIAGGHVRDLVKCIDAAQRRGTITLDSVLKRNALHWADHVVEYVEALWRRDYPAQLRALVKWDATPLQKARGIRDFFVYLLHTELSSQRIADYDEPAFLLFSPEARTRAADAVRTRADQLGLPPRKFCEELAEFWSLRTESITARADLRLRLCQFHHIVHPEEDALPLPAFVARARKSEDTKRPFRHRARPSSGAVVDPRLYLSKDQVRKIYAAASFLPQEYDVWFNVGLRLVYANYDHHAEHQGRELHSKITHGLSGLVERERTNGSDRLHWIAVHEHDNDNGFQTKLVMHLPIDPVRAREWIESQLPSAAGTMFALVPDKDWNVETRRDTQANRIATHWRLVSDLWSAIDPTLEQKGPSGVKTPLYELLRVRTGSLRVAGSIEKDRFRPSGSLGIQKQRTASEGKMPFLSAFDDGAWDHLRLGWERLEYEFRKTEKARRAEEAAAIRAQWGLSKDEKAGPACARKLEALAKKWPDNAKLRMRSDEFPFWWP